MLNHIVEFWSKKTDKKITIKISPGDIDQVKKITNIFKEQKNYKFDQDKLMLFIRTREIKLKKTYGKPDSMIEL